MALSVENLSQRRLEQYLQWCKIVQWGRKNPVKFAEEILGVEFMDYQRYVFAESWNKQFVLWLMTRNGGKSILTAPFVMTKMLLFPNFQSYILSVTSAQSQDTFMKMEKMAKRNIESFVGLTDIYMGEIVPSGSGGDGFTHSPQGFKFTLYNNSNVTSLSGAEDNLRGKRSDLNVYDESGFISENYAITTEGFCLQSADFKMGKNFDNSTEPLMLPKQLLYCSSASDENSYFYQKYRQYSKSMLCGDKNYFVADLDCEVVIGATNHGILLNRPLLTREKVESALKTNQEKAEREYFNKFSTDGGRQNPVKKAEVMKSSVVRKPIMGNEDGQNHRFVFAYDPARSYDNSIVTIVDLVETEDRGLIAKICNCVSFTDVNTKKKIPMKTPEQKKHLKQLLLNYNGKGFPDYENIEMLLIDSGSGGGGVSIGDDLMEDWVDKSGKKHRGFIDLEAQKEYKNQYPTADNKLILLSPHKYRTELFDALVEMINLNLIEFTSDYDGQDYLSLEYVEKGEVKYKNAQLAQDEKMALIQIDLMKEECYKIQRTDTNGGGHSYGLPKELEKKFHDDRAYTLGMIAWYLKQKRRESYTKKPKPKIDASYMLGFRKPKF